MPDPFAVPDNLDAILNDIWMRWGRGAADRRSPFHTPAVASIRPHATPDQRIMVLRKADRHAGLLRFHTDVRSNKVAQFAGCDKISVAGYDPGAKIQLRATGQAAVTAKGAIVDAAWAATSPSGRRSYLTTLPPGSVSDDATSGLPAPFDTTMPTARESEAGRANFALVVMTVTHLEWLHLAATGHRRAAFSRGEAGWTGTWLIP